jgi:hypothetical protein
MAATPQFAVVTAQVQKVKVDGNKIQQIVVSVTDLVHWYAGLVSLPSGPAIIPAAMLSRELHPPSGWRCGT